MLDVNMIIANNIQAELKKENKKQVDLAEGIGVSKQTMSKIMNGARAINAIELHKISEYLHVSMDCSYFRVRCCSCCCTSCSVPMMLSTLAHTVLSSL